MYKTLRQKIEDICSASSWKVGDIVRHPGGYKIKIISGQYWGTHGISNHWHWRRILKSGKLSKKEEFGYGW